MIAASTPRVPTRRATTRVNVLLDTVATGSTVTVGHEACQPARKTTRIRVQSQGEMPVFFVLAHYISHVHLFFCVTEVLNDVTELIYLEIDSRNLWKPWLVILGMILLCIKLMSTSAR
jgi:hypothetical protein